MRAIIVIVVTVAFSCFGKAQVNLVPNPSFELNTRCTDVFGNFNYLLNWYDPNLRSCDYFQTCSTLPQFAVPLNFRGYQYPRTGDAYAGFYVGSPEDSLQNREYVAIELIDTLKAGQNYCVEFYVSLANLSMYSISNLGALLTDTMINEPGRRNLHYTPSIENSDGIISDTSNWVLISEYYVARGGEKFLTIGNFRNNANTTYQAEPGWGNPNGNFAYYYIDDVSVTECEPEEPEPPKPEAGITIPNVFTPNNDGINDRFIIENLPPGYTFQIYNRWGELVYVVRASLEGGNATVRWGGHHRNGQDCTEGVYYYVLTLPGKYPVKGVVHLVR